MNELNEFKFQINRQFGTEQIVFTATIKSKNIALSDQEIKENTHQLDTIIKESFTAIQEREMFEKERLIEASERRVNLVKKLDEQLKEEMKVKKAAEVTMRDSAKLSNKLEKGNTK